MNFTQRICLKNKESPVNEHMYRKVFNTVYKISFLKPKKYGWGTCEQHKVGELSDEEYEAHITKKNDTGKEKNEDKQKAISNKSIHVFCFDLEQVLTVPKSSFGELLYKRKLNCFNLSTYSLGNSEVSNYFWLESKGKGGACEIGTCLVHYILALLAHVEHVVMFSDCCGGRNNNK